MILFNIFYQVVNIEVQTKAVNEIMIIVTNNAMYLNYHVNVDVHNQYNVKRLNQNKLIRL